MVRAEETSDVESVSAKSKRKGNSKSLKRARESTSPDEMNESDAQDKGEDDDDEGDDDEEEYEIEAILDSKKGIFAEGRTGYLVSWKGYGPEHNGWVDEKDAGNATVLIDDYWRNHKKKKANRKSLDPKPKTPTKVARKSMTKEEDSEAGSASAAPKKRGKKPKANQDSDVEMEEASSKKKSRKSNGNARSTSPQYYGEPINDSVPYGNMRKWMTTKSWEHMVDVVDTVERTESGGLDVYFTLRDGTRAKEPSDLCAQRFPQKMITFYESNLRWKEATGPDDAVSQD